MRADRIIPPADVKVLQASPTTLLMNPHTTSDKAR